MEIKQLFRRVNPKRYDQKKTIYSLSSEKNVGDILKLTQNLVPKKFPRLFCQKNYDFCPNDIQHN